MRRLVNPLGISIIGAAWVLGSAATAHADPVIDHVDVSTWAYDRLQGDTYLADNNGGKNLTVYWKSFAGSEPVRFGCTSEVTITGFLFSDTKHDSNCDSYNPGTNLHTRLPGVYKVTVTVRQEGQPDISADRDVTILPNLG